MTRVVLQDASDKIVYQSSYEKYCCEHLSSSLEHYRCVLTARVNARHAA